MSKVLDDNFFEELKNVLLAPSRVETPDSVLLEIARHVEELRLTMGTRMASDGLALFQMELARTDWPGPHFAFVYLSSSDGLVVDSISFFVRHGGIMATREMHDAGDLARWIRHELKELGVVRVLSVRFA